MFGRIYKLDYKAMYQGNIDKPWGYKSRKDSNRAVWYSQDKKTAIMISYRTIVAIIYNGRLYQSDNVYYSPTTSHHRGKLLWTCYNLGIACDKPPLSTIPFDLWLLYEYIYRKGSPSLAKRGFPSMHRLVI